MVKTVNKPNQRSHIQLLEQGDLFRQNNRPVRVLRKSTNVFLLGCESTNERTGRPVYSCVPVSVERSDADENVDADQVRTGRPVGGEQSIDLFAQREEIDIDFKSVWIATCSCETSRKLPCSRTREEDRE